MNTFAILAPVLLSGFAALSWEILWQQQISLAIGVSAQATAITLSAMMLGMSLGAGGAHAAMQRLAWRFPGRYLAFLEVAVGLLGIILPRGFALLERADTAVFQLAPAFAPVAQVTGVFLALIPPSLAMGATIPVLARLAAGKTLTVGRLYAVNLVGAALGVVGATFYLVPTLGIGITIGFTACVNVGAGLLFFLLRPLPAADVPHESPSPSPVRPRPALPRGLVTAFCTGCSAFALEVIWFRSLRAALQATTESFALMLFAVLAALAAGGLLAPRLRRVRGVTLPRAMFLAGILVIGVVPVVERFDLFVPLSGGYAAFLLKRLLIVLAVLGPPMTVLGLGLPWLLDEQGDSRRVGVLYAVNTLGALAGSLGAAWVLLPLLGVTRGAWVAGCLLFLAAAAQGGRMPLLGAGVLGAAGLVFVSATASGVGRLRVQSPVFRSPGQTVLASREGPDVTVSAVEDAAGVHSLVVDGFVASGEGPGSHYTSWMGRLPMLLHPDPKEALVICFGTGQTVNAVREENPLRVDVVDVNPAVFELAPNFPKNRGVLGDPRCQRIVMDGRAWLRRTNRQYDVITLEPMPPTFAGSNALYSLEFYQLLRARLREGGVTTQWLPFHLVDPAEGAAIVATFHRVFQEVDVSVDAEDMTTVIVGYKHSGPGERPPSEEVPPAARSGLRPEDVKLIRESLVGVAAVTSFADLGAVITDDNQLLSYGYGRMKSWGLGPPDERQKFGVNLLRRAAPGQVSPRSVATPARTARSDR